MNSLLVQVKDDSRWLAVVVVQMEKIAGVWYISIYKESQEPE